MFFLKERSLIISSLSTPAAAAVDQQRLCGLRTGLPTTLSLSPALPTLSSPNGDKADDHHDAGNKNDEKLDHLSYILKAKKFAELLFQSKKIAEY